MIRRVNTKLLDLLVDYVVDQAIDHVHTGGTPFTALVVDRGGKIIGTGITQISQDCDPTAHAEVMAIRNACKMLNVTSLNEATLIASGEPCAMCYLSALWAGIDQVVFAVDRHEAARAGFDYRWSYEMLSKDTNNWPLDIFIHRTQKSSVPFDLCKNNEV